MGAFIFADGLPVHDPIALRLAVQDAVAHDHEYQDADSFGFAQRDAIANLVCLQHFIAGVDRVADAVTVRNNDGYVRPHSNGNANANAIDIGNLLGYGSTD